jgi:predicted nuclease of predicted toxin-antitoxin system
VSAHGFAVDECVMSAIVTGLRSAGGDVLDGRTDMRGWKDEAILARCWREQRILISHDYDHGDLVFRDGQPSAGIVLLAPGLFTGSDAADPFAVAKHIAGHSSDYANAVTIIGKKHMRRKSIDSMR